MKRRPLGWPALGLAGAALLAAPALAQPQKVGAAPEAMNMRLVGYNDLQARSAYQPTIHKQGDRYIAYIGHHGGTDDVPKPMNKMTGQPEFNGTSIIDVTDPANPKYLKHIPGPEGNYEGGGAQMVRVCDGKSLPKGDPAKTYMLRVYGGMGHEIWDVTNAGQSGAADPPHGPARHPQELVGMRYRHCLSRLRRARLAGQAHDPGLRPQRPGQARAYPRLRPARPGARRDRPGPGRFSWPDLDRAEGQPDLFRLRHRQGRRAPDHRPREASQGPEGADPGEPALSRDRRVAFVGLVRRPHGLPDAGDADRRIRQGQGRSDPRHRHDRQRADPQRMRGSPADGVVRRRHPGEDADHDLDLPGAGGERPLLRPRRPVRRAFLRAKAWSRCSTRRWR